MSDEKPTSPSNDTRATEREDAQEPHIPDREPTAEEETIADSHQPDPKVAEEYEEAIERGARQEGEGKIA